MLTPLKSPSELAQSTTNKILDLMMGVLFTAEQAEQIIKRLRKHQLSPPKPVDSGDMT